MLDTRYRMLADLIPSFPSPGLGTRLSAKLQLRRRPRDWLIMQGFVGRPSPLPGRGLRHGNGDRRPTIKAGQRRVFLD